MTASALSWPDWTWPSTRRDRVEQHVDLLAEQRRDRLRRGAVRHVQHVDAGDLLEQFGGEMLGRAVAGAREHDLAGVGLGGLDQRLDVACTGSPAASR